MLQPEEFSAYLKSFLAFLGVFLLIGLLVLLPYSFWWLYLSGDSAIERAANEQAQGKFVVFGSGISQDFVDYKLQLYEKIKPEIVAIGSSRVMQFRGTWFKAKFLNMGGVAGNLAVLRSTIDAMLAISRPKAIIMGLDFWWFLPQWEAHPEKLVAPTSGSYNYSYANLKKPWEWLVEGKISLWEFLAPIIGIFGKGFASDRYGIMAQQTSDGFGPDGSWYYTAESTGLKKALDYQFMDTVTCVEKGIKAFFHARGDQHGPALEHLRVFEKIIRKLEHQGIKVFLFIPPLAPAIWVQMKDSRYPHLFKLQESLEKSGFSVLDFSNAIAYGASDCEFIDGFHGGEVAYARILLLMAEHWPGLLTYINMEKLHTVIEQWGGHALVANPALTQLPEIDFLGLGCSKRAPAQVNNEIY